VPAGLTPGRWMRLALISLGAFAVAGGAYAFTAANTVPNSNAGAGSGAVSGYTVSNLHYALNAATPTNVDSLSFAVSPAIPAASGGTVMVQATLATGGANTYQCTTDTNGTAVTCATTAPRLTAENLVSVTVVAAQGGVAAPAPATATSTVTEWTKIRGGNLIVTAQDGGVQMVTGTGERRVLAGSPTAADYTVTSAATLLSGAGYGVYVRATVDAGTRLSGYCIQVDHAYGTGEIVVREIQDDAELSTPIARIALPTGFVWFGVEHLVAVTVNGNSMTVGVDGAQLGTVPDLAATSAKSAKSSSGLTTAVVPPAAGGYGLRAWGDGLVSLRQMTLDM
jgi:hypothetical protein